ncbi:glycerol-3-phosphate 1-O-acyltransferase PlsY [Acetobacteraceae bacterium]|nr:glycerol-3-phosphate 1-O-acyltransferase PlsY [Acetobacteraceae bacterium]
MSDTIELILIVVIASYLCGSIPFGLLLTKFSGSGDIRKVGSGNIGATNVLRTGNKKLAGATFLLDAIKGALPALVIYILAPETQKPLLAGIACFTAVFAHCYPIWLGFKGGKGVATGVGAMLALSWLAALSGFLLWLVIVWRTRYSSLGGLAACLAMIVLVPLFGHYSFLSPAPLATDAISILIFWRHRSNLTRLCSGTESKVSVSQTDRPQG